MWVSSDFSSVQFSSVAQSCLTWFRLQQKQGKFPGVGSGNTLQLSCLENSMDRRAWQPTLHGVAVGHNWAHFSSVQLLSCVQLFETPWTAARQTSLSITNLRRLLNLMSVESVMPSNHLILCRPLLLPPSILPSIRVFSNVSILCIRWPKYWTFSFIVSPVNEYSGLISFRMDCVDLLAVQGTLKSLLQHYSSKASIFLHSVFFIDQLSHPYLTTGKTIALTRRTFVGKIMSLLFNKLPSLGITFLPSRKCLLISRLSQEWRASLCGCLSDTKPSKQKG